MSYAKRTEVPVEKSRAEIERILTRFGAKKFASGWDPKGAAVMFEAHGRCVRFLLPLEDAKGEQQVRSRWRTLTLTIKAKIEAVSSGISDFEAEFLAFIVLPGGDTVGNTMAPLLVKAYQTGVMPQLRLGA